jgi:hypothetical protein
MYGTWIGVTALLPVCIYSNQLPSNTDLGVITVKIATDLPISYIAIYLPKAICCFLLGLMPKLNKTFCCIYNLFLPKPCLSLSINATILEAYSTLTYSTIDEILALILFAGRGAVILKCNLKDAF